MKKFFFPLLVPFFLFAYQVQIKSWHKGDSFYRFLKSNNIPISLYYSLNKKTQKQLRMISANAQIYLLKKWERDKTSFNSS